MLFVVLRSKYHPRSAIGAQYVCICHKSDQTIIKNVQRYRQVEIHCCHTICCKTDIRGMPCLSMNCLCILSRIFETSESQHLCPDVSAQFTGFSYFILLIDIHVDIKTDYSPNNRLSTTTSYYGEFCGFVQVCEF
jgi:hypothetical protein